MQILFHKGHFTPIKCRFCFIQPILPHKMQILLHTGILLNKIQILLHTGHVWAPPECEFCLQFSNAQKYFRPFSITCLQFSITKEHCLSFSKDCLSFSNLNFRQFSKIDFRQKYVFPYKQSKMHCHAQLDVYYGEMAGLEGLWREQKFSSNIFLLPKC